MQPSHHSPSSDAQPPARVMTLPLSALACFRRLMQYQGQEVNLSRLCADRAYAYGCLAAAHASGDEVLRGAALALFSTYERNTEAPTLH